MGIFNARLVILLLFTLFVILGLLLWVRSLNTPEFQRDLEEAEELEQAPLKPWREYNSAIAEFSAEFPGYPQHAQENRPVPNSDWVLNYQLYVAQDIHGADFMVSMVKYPEPMAINDPSLVLNTVVDEMREVSATNKIDDLNTSDYQGHPSVSFSVTGEDRIIHSRAVLVGKKLYLLMVAHPPTLDLKEDFKRFENSFQLLDIPQQSDPTEGEEE